jgi:hypothetical protein
MLMIEISKCLGKRRLAELVWGKVGEKVGKEGGEGVQELTSPLMKSHSCAAHRLITPILVRLDQPTNTHGIRNERVGG